MITAKTIDFSRLAIGTAQFGFDYGVTNSQGQVSPSEIKQILSLAQSISLRTIDTARLYGSSEDALGQIPLSSFDIVTKFSLSTFPEAKDPIESSLNTSLQKLKVDQVYGLLAHSFDEFMANSDSILKSVEKLKEYKKIKKFGVSVYDPSQAEKILHLCTPDLIQIPMNIFDQRFLLSGMLSQLAQKKVEVHVRSAFLQGVLLQKTQDLHSFFDFCKDHYHSLDRFIEQNSMGRMQACLKFLLDLPEVAKIVVGVCSRQQLSEITDSLLSIRTKNEIDFSPYHFHDPRLINPLSWPMLKR